MFENPRRGRQARNFTKNVPKILDLKSSSEQIFSENWRWVPLIKEGFSVSDAHRSCNKYYFGFQVTGPDWRTSILGGLEFSILGFLGVGKFGKKCTLLLNLPEYLVTGVSPLIEWGREKRKEWQQGAFSPFFFPPFIPILPTICCETVVMETRERGEGTEATVCLPFVVFSFQPPTPPIPRSDPLKSF